MKIQSVSAWPEKRGEIKKMMELAAKDIERLGGTVELVDIGKQMVKSPGFHIWRSQTKLLKRSFLHQCRRMCHLSFCSRLQLPSGEEIPLPPIILGHLGSDQKKKTVCIYGHLDVQPANIDDGWDTEPFKLVEKDGKKKKKTSVVSFWF